MTTINSTELRWRWRDGGEVALFDVRDESDFAAKHLFFAVSLPLPEIKSRLFYLLPLYIIPILSITYLNLSSLTPLSYQRSFIAISISRT